MSRRTRRTVLAGATTGALGALAGCNALDWVLPGGDSKGPTYDGGDPEPYARYMRDDRLREPGGTTIYFAPSRLSEVVDRLHHGVADSVRSLVEWTGLPIETPEHMVATGESVVVTGGFTRAEARRALADRYGEPTVVEDGAYEAWFEAEVSPLLLGEDAVVSLSRQVGPDSDPQRAREVTRETFGDWNGTAAALEGDDSLTAGVRTLVDLLGSPPVAGVGNPRDTFLRMDLPPGPSSDGGPTAAGWDIGRDRTAARFCYGAPGANTLDEVFPDIDLDERYLPGIDDYDGLDVWSAGRALVAEGTIDTRDVDFLLVGDPRPPDGSFDFEYDEGAEVTDTWGPEPTGTLTVRYTGQEPIPARMLRITVGELLELKGFRKTTTDGWVENGDAVTVGAQSGTTVYVRWIRRDTPQNQVVLGEFDVP